MNNCESSIFHDINIERAMKKKGSTGISIALSIDGKEEFFSLGSGRPNCQYPIKTDTLFQAGSVSKAAFALTLMRFSDKGIIDLDKDISKYCSEFVSSPITFSALLSHTAGFNVHGFRGYKQTDKNISIEQVLSGNGNSKKIKMIYPYGKKYVYSGNGIELAELAFTRITGMSLACSAQEELFSVLDMKNSTFVQPLENELTGRAAFSCKRGLFDDGSSYHYYPENAAAGLWTTPSDLVKMGLAISESCLKDGFIKKDTALRMIKPVCDSYGQCIEIFSDNVYGHDGVNYGFQCFWRFSNIRNSCIAICENTNGGCLKIVGKALEKELNT